MKWEQQGTYMPNQYYSLTRSCARRALLTSAAAAAFIAAAPTHAGPTLTPTGWASPPPGYETFSVHVGSLGLDGSVSAGGFTGTWGPDTVLFWCYELNEFFSFGNAYTDYTATTVSDPVANTALSRLFTEAGGSAAADSSDDTSAAFQLAVWEIKYDTGGPYKLDSGNFQVAYDHGNIPNAVTIAQGWLDALSLGGPAAYTITLLSSVGNPGHQDFIMGSTTVRQERVPEPSPIPLLGAGLMAMIFALRRRQGARG